MIASVIAPPDTPNPYGCSCDCVKCGLNGTGKKENPRSRLTNRPKLKEAATGGKLSCVYITARGRACKGGGEVQKNGA
jgi:hypothetical protein